MGSNKDVAAEGTQRARAELNEMQRKRLGPTEAIGDLVIAVVVPVLFWDDVPRLPLVVWALSVAAIAYFWEVLNKGLRDRPEHDTSRLTWFGWVSTLVWGALPWIMWPALDDRGAVWILVFVVVFAIAADTVFVTQTSAVSIDEMVVVYAGSFLLAFGLHGAYVAIIATVLAGATFVIGGAGLGKVTAELVTKRLESEQRIRIDQLTGIGTRVAATEAMKRFVRDGANEIHCAFFDLDDFKQLNDNYGYEVGDEALRTVARLLVEALPDDWTVARFGGDEFVAVGVTSANLEATVDFRMALPMHGGLVLSQPLSVGLTTCSTFDLTSDGLFQEGAAALRMAKRLGKRQVVLMTDELRASERSSSQLGRRAAEALDDGEIVPWGQPIVRLADRKVVGIEILARWPQLDGTMVMPTDFVPVIEDQGRGPALGLLMIGHAIDALASPELRDSDVYVSVNISAKHLFHSPLPNEIRTLLAKRSVDAHRLVIEITESQQLPSSPIWGETARQLRELGVGLAIDDFGSGYSSMEKLLSMPFSHIKVDRVMTSGVGLTVAAKFAAAIAAMAAESGMVTIVEGIESEIELSTMVTAGCIYGQGYLFSRPVPLLEVLASLSHGEQSSIAHRHFPASA